MVDHKLQISDLPSQVSHLKSSICVFLSFSFAALICTLSVAYGDGVGTTGNALLRVGVGARATAMGDTFVGIADDVHAIYWNPAGIHQIGRPQLAVMHAEWLADTRYEWVGFVQNLGSWFSLGIDLSYLYTGEIPRTVETGFDGYRTDGLFNYTNNVIRLALGSRSYRNIRLGLAFQVFQQELTFTQTRYQVPSPDSDSTSMNLGILYEPSFRLVRGNSMSTLRLGAILQNVRGNASGLIRQDDELPTLFKLGASLHLRPSPSPLEDENARATTEGSGGGSMVVATDLVFSSERPFSLHTGVEYHFPNGFTLRSGYRTGTDFDFLSSWSFGVGYASSGYEIDYAVTPFGRLGNVHRVSMKLDF